MPYGKAIVVLLVVLRHRRRRRRCRSLCIVESKFR